MSKTVERLSTPVFILRVHILCFYFNLVQSVNRKLQWQNIVSLWEMTEEIRPQEEVFWPEKPGDVWVLAPTNNKLYYDIIIN